MTNVRDELLREARRIEEDANYSARSHFVAARRWRAVHLWVGIPTVIASAVSGLSALGQFDNHNVIAGLLALLVAAAIAVTTFLNPHKQASVHLEAGNRFLALRNQARFFYTIDCRDQQHTDTELTTMLRRLAHRRDSLNQNAPAIPHTAFITARKGIEEGEARYEVDTAAGE